MSVNQTLCNDVSVPAPVKAGAITTALTHAVLRTACRVQEWRERARQRRMLATLDDRMLKDIGISRASARMEVSKRFWQP